ncbi:MAG TPA: hypothetical protein VMT18_03050 [Planctomycetota bacterium]|nr:hypothetical protein [Planctomycetota bacterium]
MHPLARLLVPALTLATCLHGHARAQCGPDYLQELLPPDPQLNTAFGLSVGVAGDVLVTGNPLADYDANGSGFRGALYVWRRSGGSFVFEQKIPGPAAPQAQLGVAVAVDGDTIAAGQHANSYPAAAVRVYRHNGVVWNEEAFLLPADPLFTNGPQLHAVGIDGDWIAAGHYTALLNPPTPPFTGAVYLYRRNAGIWSQHSKLVPADAANGDVTGWSLDLRGGVLAYSSRAQYMAGAGRVHVYGLASGAPVLEATLVATTPPSVDNQFGYALSTDGVRLAVGNPSESGGTSTQGEVHIFRREGGTWILEQIVRPFLPTGAFGREVAIDGDDLYAGSHNAWPSKVHHFRRIGGAWLDMGTSQPTDVPVWGVSSLDAEDGSLVAGSNTVYNSSGGLYVFDGDASQQVCTYCTAKVNSQGCTPVIGWSGLPSASAGSGFLVRAALIVPGMNGILIYSPSATAATPFQGGLLCFGSPVVRTPLQNAGGSAPCSGTYSMDFNALIASGIDPTLEVGAIVRAQYWSRDPAASFASNMTDAISFVIAP